MITIIYDMKNDVKLSFFFLLKFDSLFIYQF